jgi:hypothetical protein
MEIFPLDDFRKSPGNGNGPLPLVQRAPLAAICKTADRNHSAVFQ